MNWLSKTIGSSIGKKLLMALTGLSFCGFLTTHLLGNLTVYGGSDLFLSYVHHLHSMGVLIPVAEVGLLTLFVIHVIVGIVLFLKNSASRPNRYAVNKNAGGRTLGSGTMPYTGLVILGFIIYHLVNLRFADHVAQNAWQILTAELASPLNTGLYIAAMVFVAVHVSHGFWSLFQTVGLSHPKYMPAIKGFGVLFSLVVGIGFGFIPVFLMFLA